MQAKPGDLPRVILIGGVAAAGKTETALALAARLGRPLVALDGLHRAVRDAAGAGRDLDAGDLPRAVIAAQGRAAAQWALRTLCDLGAVVVVEGGWVWPAAAAPLVAEGCLWAGFCGYAGTTPAARIALVAGGPVRADRPHWSARQDAAAAEAHFARQIAASADCRAACATLGLAYFDYDDPAAGQAALFRALGL